ncbi:hypothetical protein [Labrenzia sp. CE80]|uniref:hypothetical protein n=1 Tax=Labrenzia sp. CE80 TaxID=1788986 RepID=UPI00129A6DF6|nr:hypothetical protein [Labrenzia sp. CE80]
MTRRMFIELAATFLVYAVVLAISLTLVQTQAHGSTTWYLTSLAPVPTLIPIAIVLVRNVLRIDELQRRIQLEALAVAFAGTGLLSMSYGFLENVGFPQLSMFAVWPVMGALWAVTVIINQARYT